MKHYSAIDKRRIVEKIMAMAKDPNAKPLAELCASFEITVDKFQLWKKALGICESFVAPEAPAREKSKSELITEAIDTLDRLCEGVLIAAEVNNVIHYRRKGGEQDLLDAVNKMDSKWSVGLIGIRKP